MRKLTIFALFFTLCAYCSKEPSPAVKPDILSFGHRMASVGKQFFTRIAGLGTALYRPKKDISYDGHIEYIEKSSSRYADARTATVVCHGWDLPGPREYRHNFYELTYRVLPGMVVAFDLPGDTSCLRDRNIFHHLRFLKHSSFGQWPDILPTISVIRQALETKKIEQLFLYGHSRGGALLLNVIAVLDGALSGNELYRKRLQEINITPKDCRLILKSVQKGGIILDCPLGNMNTAALNKRLLFLLLPLLWLFTDYDPRSSLQGDISVRCLQKLNIRTYAFFAENDGITGNRASNRKLCEELEKAGALIEERVVPGGHLHCREEPIGKDTLDKFFGRSK